MRNNAPVEHCVAEAFTLHREIVLTMKASFSLRAYLTTEVARKSAMKNKNCVGFRSTSSDIFQSESIAHPRVLKHPYNAPMEHCEVYRISQGEINTSC